MRFCYLADHVNSTVSYPASLPQRSSLVITEPTIYILFRAFVHFTVCGEMPILVLEPHPQQKPPPQVHVVVAQDLHLRLQPDPQAPDVLDYRMPQGSQVTVIGDCQVWTGSGRGAQDADNIWCPVLYGGYRGWANAYFLALGDGRRYACVLYPSAQGCLPPSADVW